MMGTAVASKGPRTSLGGKALLLPIAALPVLEACSGSLFSDRSTMQNVQVIAFPLTAVISSALWLPKPSKASPILHFLAQLEEVNLQNDAA